MKPQPIPITIEKEGTVHSFDSIGKCSKFLQCQSGQLIQNHVKSYKGWKITILGERHKISHLKVPVFLFSESGMLVEKFESVHDCHREIQIPPKKVCEIAKKESKIPFGKYMNYILKYQS